MNRGSGVKIFSRDEHRVKSWGILLAGYCYLLRARDASLEMGVKGVVSSIGIGIDNYFMPLI